MGYDIEVWVKVSAYIGGALAMGLGAIGAAAGEGYTAAQANAAIGRNPSATEDIFKTMLVGQAIAETAAIFAMVIALLLLMTDVGTPTLLTTSVLLGSGLCMGFGAFGSGLGSGLPAGEACKGIARQPGASGPIRMNMLAGTAITQTPSIFALVTALILLFGDFTGRPLAPTWAALLGAGLAAGLGAIGSGIGDGLVASGACEGVARRPDSSGLLTKMMLLGQAVTETTAVYGLLISFILMFKTVPATNSISAAMALLGAGLCMGIGAIGPGIGEGITARSAVLAIARNEEATADLTRMMLVGQAVSESTGIYSLVVALLLIFVL
jgi:F-type H+-transporting ATPase subunit c